MESRSNSGQVFNEGATTSQHVDAEDDKHFENTTFKLKRTRSLGLLDGYIAPMSGQQLNSSPGESIDNQKGESETNGKEMDENKSCEISEASNVDSPSLTGAENQSSAALTVSATPITIKSPENVPFDDTNLLEEPSLHVDYLSHEWDVSDISKSWRYIILKRKDVSDSARLENASWRTWAQKRGNLETISAESLNWSKENDVTWLYGPIVKDDHDSDNEDNEQDTRSTTASSKVAGDISLPGKGLKSILKRSTVEEKIMRHTDLLKIQLTANKLHEQSENKKRQYEKNHQSQNTNDGSSGGVPEFDDYDAISAKLNSQYSGMNNNSKEENLDDEKAEKKDLAPIDTSSSYTGPESLKSPGSAAINEEKEKKHIHFNEEVQQCVVIDVYSDEEDYYEEDEDNYYNESEDYGDDGYIYETPEKTSLDDDDDDVNDDSDSEDEGGFFLQVKSSTANLGGLVPTLSDHKAHSHSATENTDTDSMSTETSKLTRTIHRLPSTTINYGSLEEDSDDNETPTGAKGYNYYYDYNTVYTVDPKDGSYTEDRSPDVVDVPKNIELGSNVDYEIIENATPSSNYHGQAHDQGSTKSNESAHSSGKNSPIVPQNRTNVFADSSDDSYDSSDDGLSIQSRRSSQSLAQLVLGSGGLELLKSPNSENFEHSPLNEHVTSFNPQYSSTTLLGRQPASTNSLASQFFGTEMTSCDKSLSEQFLGKPANLEITEKSESSGRSGSSAKSETSDMADSLDKSDNSSSKGSGKLESFKAENSPQPGASTNSKSTPLSPQTSEAMAFRGSKNSLNEDQTKIRRGRFNFDSDSEDDSESDSEDRNDSGWASLSRVADRSGIRSPDSQSHGSGIMGQAKGLATQILGNWKQAE